MKKTVQLLLIMALLWAVPAQAHKVNLFAYVEGGQIYSESYFPDGRPIKQGVVEIYTAADELLLQGLTDDQGLYRCAIPRFVDLQLRLRASMGHQTRFDIAQAELEAGR